MEHHVTEVETWTYEYDNHGNGAFWEWWDILKDRDKIGTVTTSEEDAKMVCAMLNACERLSAVSVDFLIERYSKYSPVGRELRAYVDTLEGK